MGKQVKRILAWLMAVMISINTLPANVFADTAISQPFTPPANVIRAIANVSGSLGGIIEVVKTGDNKYKKVGGAEHTISVNAPVDKRVSLAAPSYVTLSPAVDKDGEAISLLDNLYCGSISSDDTIANPIQVDYLKMRQEGEGFVAEAFSDNSDTPLTGTLMIVTGTEKVHTAQLNIAAISTTTRLTKLEAGTVIDDNEIISAKAMYDDAFPYEVSSEGTESISLKKITGSDDSVKFYYSPDVIDKNGKVSPDLKLTECTDVAFVEKDGSYELQIVGSDGLTVGDTHIYMVYDAQYQFEFKIKSAVNEHTEDDCIMYFLMGGEGGNQYLPGNNELNVKTVDANQVAVRELKGVLTGHLGDSFTSKEIEIYDGGNVIHTPFVYVPYNDGNTVGTWFAITGGGGNASDGGVRENAYSFKNYIEVDANTDRVNFFEIEENDGKIGLYSQKASTTWGKRNGGKNNNRPTITVNGTVTSNVMGTVYYISRPSVFLYDYKSSKNEVEVNHIQLRLPSSIALEIDGKIYTGSVSIYGDGNGQTKCRIVELSYDGQKIISMNEKQSLAKDNDQETKSTEFTARKSDKDNMGEFFKKFTVKVHYALSGTLTNVADANDKIIYGEGKLLEGDMTLTPEQLELAYKACPRHLGFDVILDVTAAVKANLEKDPSLTITKIWVDEDNKYKTRPDSVTVELEKFDNGDGQWKPVEDSKNHVRKFVIPAPTNKDDNVWTLEIKDLPMSDGDVVNQYRIKPDSEEMEIYKNLNLEYQYDAVYNGLTVTNTLKITGVKNVNVHKNWESMAGEGYSKPASIEIGIYQDENLYDTVELNEATGWSGSFKNIPLYRNGKKINYEVFEHGDNGEKINDDIIQLDENNYLVQRTIELLGTGIEVTNEYFNAPHKTETTPGDGSLVKVGEEITYEITWQNYRDNATVTITDELDEGVDFVGASNDGKYDAAKHTVTWTIPNQVKGADGTVTLTVKANANALKENKAVQNSHEGHTHADLHVYNQAEVQVNNDAKVKTEEVENPVWDPHKTEETPGNGNLVKVGEEITYKITWQNYKKETATVTITDELDKGVDFVGAVPEAKYDSESHTVTWKLENREAGEQGDVTLTVRTNAKAIDENKLAQESHESHTHAKLHVYNQAEVQIDNNAVKTEEVENPVWDPHKTETKPGIDMPVKPGDEITYEISWQNYETDAADVIITDALDKNVEFVSASKNSAYDKPTHTVTWTLEKVPAGKTGSVTLTVRVLDSAVEQGKVENQANVKVGEKPGVDTEIIPNPVPNPKKKEMTPGPDEMVQVGDEITYEITWKNYRKEEANVVVTDKLDSGVDYVSAEPKDNVKYDELTHTVTWTFEAQPAGTEDTVSLTVKVNEKAAPAGIVNNQATVKVGNDDGFDTEIIPNPVADPHKTETAPGDGKLVKVGQEITYKISWKNYKKEAADIIITDELDEGVDFVLADKGAVYDGATRTVTWTLENQEAGASGEVTLTVKTNENALKDNKAVQTSHAGHTHADLHVYNQADVQVGNDLAVKTEEVVNPVSDPHKTETEPGKDLPVKPGDEITYEISWQNYRAETATVTITDKLDDNVEFVSADNNGVYDEKIRTVTWTLPAQQTKAKGVVTLTVIVKDSAVKVDEVKNQAKVTVGNDPAVETEEIPNPTWDPHKTEPTPGAGKLVHVGDEITYEISWKNYKTEAADVVIRDPLDVGVEFVSADNGGVYDKAAHTVNWTLTEQPAGAEGKVQLVVKVTDKALPAGKVKNWAFVKVGNDPEVQTEVIENPTPKVDKEEVTPGADQLVKVGDEITYEIIWNNYESQSANVTITDPLDKGVDFVYADNGGVYSEQTHTVTWNLGVRPAGDEGKVTLIVKVNGNATPVGNVANTAGVQVGNNPKIGTKTIENPTPELHKRETDPGDGVMVLPGETITYVIEWKNYKSETATVTIRDPLDKNVEFVSADNGGTVNADGEVIWVLKDQPAGKEGTVQLVVRVLDSAVEAGVVDNQAHVSVGNDPEMDTEIVENPVPNPKKTESDPGENEVVFVGDVITYEITWRNYKEEAAEVVITDPLDEGVDFISASNGGKEAGHTVTWNLGTQPAGAQGSVILTVRVNEKATPEGKVANTAGVKVGNDAEVRTKTIENPTPDQKKEEVTPGAGETVYVGDIITYTITWKNYTEEIADVIIRDPLDAGVEFVSADNNGSYDPKSHEITWTLKSQKAGATGVVTFAVKVTENAVPAGEVLNWGFVKVGNDPEVKTETIQNPTPHPEKTETAPGEDELVTVGDEITYEIEWENYRSEKATVTVVDTLDKGVDFVSADNGGTYSEKTHTVTWNLGEQEAGKTGSVKLVVKVNLDAIPAEVVENQAGVKVGNDKEVKTNIIKNPTPKQKKEELTPGADEVVFVGDEITYQITWKNYRKEPATVVVRDPLDAGVDFVSADNSGVYDAASHTVTWTLGEKPAGEEGTLKLVVRVNADATPVGKVINQAHVKVGNDPEVDTEIIENPTPNPKKEEVTPGMNKPVVPGEEITYEISWKNYQQKSATVTVTDTLDLGVDFVKASDSGSYNAASHTVTWTLKDQAAGAEGKVTLVVVVNENAVPSGVVNNQASVQVGHDPKVDTEIIPNEIPKPKKEETEPGANEMVQEGDEITYKITWRNYEEEAADVIIRDPLDAGVDFVSADNGGVYDAETHTVTWTLKAQEAGAEGVVTLTVKVNADAAPAGEVNNQAFVKVGNDAEVETEIIPNPVPNPEKEEIEPGANEMVQEGDEITYEITWRNYEEEAADVIIRDPLDPGVDFVSADNGGVYDAATHTVTWTLKAQEAGAEGVVTLTVKVNADAAPTGEVNNQAFVKVGNDAEVETDIIPNPVPNPKKEETEPGAKEIVQVGDEITYEITWRNYEEEAADVIIRDPLDAGVDFVSADNGGVYDAAVHTVTWTLKAQEAKAEGVVTLTVKVNADAAPAGEVNNQAFVKVGNDAEVETEIIPNPVPNPEKEEIEPGANEMVQEGDEITYEITWRNYEEEAADVIIRDPLDTGVDFVSADNGGVYDAETHTVTWTLEAQEAGAEGVVTLTVKVNADAAPVGEVNNQAFVKVGNDAEVETDIIPNPVPNPKKEETEPGAKEIVQVGDEITYEITWRNYEEEAADVIIRDPLDAGVDFVSADNGGVYDAATHTVTWTLKAQEAKAEGVVTLTVEVNADAETAGEVNNQAFVKVGNDAEVETEIIPNPVPNPEKEEIEPGANEMVQEGDEITYEITWRNYEEEAADVIIRDPLDTGVDFVSADNGGVYDAATHTVTWTLKAQEAGTEGVVTLTVKVNADAAPAGEVNNQALVKVGNDAEVETDIIPNPVPNPKKEEVEPGRGRVVIEGDEITYKITWRNYEEEAADVIIRDPLDAGVDFVSADNGGVYDAETHTVTWTLEAQEAGAEGEVLLTVVVNENAAPVGEVNNQAFVKVGNDAEVETDIIPNPVPERQPEKVEVTPGEDEPVQTGDEITYEITWKNYRDVEADVIIRDPLDPGVDFVSADNGGVYEGTSHTVTWTLEKQPAGAEGVVELVVTVNDQAPSAGIVNNQAFVKVGNDAEVETSIIPNPVPNPEKIETMPGDGEEVHPHDVITYEITYRNYKAEPATVTITDPLDPGLDFSEAGEGGVYDEASHTVTWVLEDVPSEEEGAVHLTVIVNEDAKSDDYLVENQAGVQVAHDPVIDTDIVENPVPDLPENGTIEVTKNLLYNDEPLNAADAVYYVALFTDAECTNMIPDTMKAIEFVNASSSTVVYENVEVGRTYYVGEVDADGNLIEVMGTVEDGTEFFVNFYDGNETVVEEPDGTVTITFNNEFLSIPDGYTLNGILNITKKLLGADGKPADSDEVFYAGIFDDAEFTQPSSQVDYNVVALELGGGSETTVSVNVIAFKGDEERTVYVTEVDEDGVPVDDSFAYEVTITDGTAVFNESHVRHDVVITNQPEDHSDDKPGTPVSPTPVPSGGKGSNPVKTGDDTPIGLYVSLLAVAVLAMGGAFWFRRRRRNTK